jgi:hypothetical protein
MPSKASTDPYRPQAWLLCLNMGVCVCTHIHTCMHTCIICIYTYIHILYNPKKNKDGSTALSVATRRGHTSISSMIQSQRDCFGMMRTPQVLSLLALLVQKYKYWRRSWYKSTNTDAVAVSRQARGRPGRFRHYNISNGFRPRSTVVRMSQGHIVGFVQAA